MPDNQNIDDMTEVAVFLVFLEHHDPLAMWGSRHVTKVVNAFARLIGADPKEFRLKLLKDFAGDDD